MNTPTQNSKLQENSTTPFLHTYYYFINTINYKFCIQTGETPSKHGNPYIFTQNSDTITETADFCLIVRFLPQSPSYQRYQKSLKREAHQSPR